MEYSAEQLKTLAARRWGIALKGSGKELHGSCPHCMAGHDRFVVWTKGTTWCRVCQTNGWIEDNRLGWKPDPVAEEELRKWLAGQAAERRRELEQWQKAHDAGYVQGWHDAMNEQNLAFWRRQGIESWAVDYYGLGYCKDKTFMGPDGQMFHSPAYTIPIREPREWNLVNTQYRLAGPMADRAGKYRQEANIPAASFWAEQGKVDGAGLVVEGAKKSIVLFDFLEYRMQVVGLPGLTPAQSLIEDLKCFDRVFLLLDPSTPGSHHERAVARFANVLGNKLRVASLGMKPDDAVLAGLTKGQLRSVLGQARQA